jgi:hypothetical protein
MIDMVDLKATYLGMCIGEHGDGGALNALWSALNELDI